MLRKTRLDVPGALHHIMVPGILIISKDEYAWMGRAHVLGQFTDTKERAIRGHRRFVQEGLGEG
jgi:hypothetical protein